MLKWSWNKGKIKITWEKKIIIIINTSYCDHVLVKSAETFKSPGNSDKFYNGCLLTRSFDEYICCS